MAVTYPTFTDPTGKTGFIVSGGGAHSLTDLQFAGDIKGGEDFGKSALVSLNSDKQIQAGLASATSMPMWAINGAQDLDASMPKYNLPKGSSTSVQGSVNCLPATGGYELATTEYNVDDYVAADYAPGTPLTNDTDTAGQIEPAPAGYSTVTVLGIVSTGVQATTAGINKARRKLNQKALLHFWTTFQLPYNAG